MAAALPAACTVSNPNFARSDGSGRSDGGAVDLGTTGGLDQARDSTVPPSDLMPGRGDMAPKPTDVTGQAEVSGGGGVGGGGGGGGSGGGGGGGGDGSADSAPDAISDAAPYGPVPPHACGTAQPALNAIVGARGIAIDDDGTIYFSRDAGGVVSVGRLEVGGRLTTSWQSLPANSQPRVIRIDRRRRRLYVALTGTDTVAAYDLVSNQPAYGASQIPGAHGLAVHEDGSVYISARDGHIYRLVDKPTVRRAVVTTFALSTPDTAERPLGIAFGADGRLWVGTSTGRIVHLTLQDGLFGAPQLFSLIGAAVQDLAFDVKGALYIASFNGSSARELTRLLPSRMVDPLFAVTGLFSGLAFGRGGFPCQDLYVSDVNTALKRYTAPERGLDIP